MIKVKSVVPKMLKPLTGLRATFKFQNFLHKKINENISTQLELTKR